jgi:hypothetical protein
MVNGERSIGLKSTHHSQKSIAMIKKILRVAFRNLWRHGIFSFINIMGLAVGMTACFLIFLYIHFEPNYDSFQGETNRILVATGILAALIVLFTLSFWTIKAITNPVKSLRTD